MKILGIETSCDETGASIVEDGVQIISNSLASSIAIQQKWGGVVPEQAAREQIKSIVPVISESLENFYDIDVIAVTVGPGLIGSLLIGVETVKTLAYVWNKPIVPVNHLVGHIYGCWLRPTTTQKSKLPTSSAPVGLRGAIKTQNLDEKLPEFPAVVLLVSGGHTELILMKNHGKFGLLGTTRDDAAGEAFDKTARLLGLPYPGGPAIAAAAGKFKIRLPRPMINDNSFDFSFSGLKTAVLREVQKRKDLKSDFVSQMAFEIQESITDVLVKKTMSAVEQFLPKSLLVCGGVAANKRLREKFEEEMKNYSDIKLFFPPIEYCTDNAATIASAAYFNYKPAPLNEITVDPGLEIE